MEIKKINLNSNVLLNIDLPAIDIWNDHQLLFGAELLHDVTRLRHKVANALHQYSKVSSGLFFVPKTEVDSIVQKLSDLISPLIDQADSELSNFDVMNNENIQNLTNDLSKNKNFMKLKEKLEPAPLQVAIRKYYSDLITDYKARLKNPILIIIKPTF